MVTQSSCIAKLILIACLTTSFLQATTIRFISHAKQAYTAYLSMAIDTFDATDVIHIAPQEKVERLYDTESVRFTRMVIESEKGRSRTYIHPFDTSFSDVWLVHLYENSIEITYPF